MWKLTSWGFRKCDTFWVYDFLKGSYWLSKMDHFSNFLQQNVVLRKKDTAKILIFRSLVIFFTYGWKTPQESVITWITHSLSFYWISEICWIYITHMVCLKDFSRKYIDLNHPAIVLLLIFQSMLTCITHMIKKHLKKVCWLESPSHCPVDDFPKYVDLHHPYV